MKAQGRGRSCYPIIRSCCRALSFCGGAATKSSKPSAFRGSTSPSLTPLRSEEHTSELQSLMRISYAVFCLKKKTTITNRQRSHYTQTRAQKGHITTITKINNGYDQNMSTKS